jgi:hypothetical protein
VDAYLAGWEAKRELIDRAATPGTAPPGTDGTTDDGSGAAPATETPPTTGRDSELGSDEGESPAYSGPTRSVFVVGDAGSAPIADAMATWGTDAGAVQVTSAPLPCGILRQNTRADGDAQVPVPDECRTAVYGWLQAIVATDPDVVVVLTSAFDAVDQVLDGDPAQMVRGPGDETFDTFVAQQYKELADAVLRLGKVVLWVGPPPLGAVPDGERRSSVLERQVQALRVGREGLLYADLGNHLEGAGGDAEWRLGAGGIETDEDTARSVGEWLGRELLTQYDEYLVYN